MSRRTAHTADMAAKIGTMPVSKRSRKLQETIYIYHDRQNLACIPLSPYLVFESEMVVVWLGGVRHPKAT
jgi:hypothetical protein